MIFLHKNGGWICQLASKREGFFSLENGENFFRIFEGRDFFPLLADLPHALAGS